jgi:small redox-active disulfide protein 2
MRIQVFGPGCARCKELAENTRKAVEELGLDVEVEKVEDLREMAKAGILSTPALAVDGKLRLSGRAATAAEIKALLG